MKLAILGVLAVLAYISLLECIALWIYKEPVDEAEVIRLRRVK